MSVFLRLPALFVVLASLATIQLAAQKITKPKYETGIRLSALVYQGDLAPSPLGSYKSPAPGAGIFVTRIIDWSWGARFTADFGKLKSDDALYATPAWRQQRNFSFSTSFLEVSAQMVYTIGDNYQAHRPHGYVFAGAGYTFLDIKRDYSKFNPDYYADRPWLVQGLEADGKEPLPKGCLVFPVGAGLRAGIGDYMSVYAEGAYRLMSTDYLDGFSRAANPGLLDHYTNFTIGLIYRFGDNYINCPRY